MYLGIDIGGTEVKIGYVSEKGEIQKMQSYSVSFDGYETPILQTVLEKIDVFFDSQKIVRTDIIAIGVSATGAINSNQGVVAGSAGHIKNWEGSCIKDELQKKYHIPVYVLNDANAAALGEAWMGAAKDKRNAIVMTVGTGIGGGIIVDSKVLQGRDGFAGEIGHIMIQCEGEKCSCGNIGCLEHLGSMNALIRMVKKAINEKKISWNENETIDGRHIFEQVRIGNKALEEIVELWITYISVGIINLVHILNPEIVIIGGGVSAQKELFIDKIREKVLESGMHNFTEGLEICAAQFKNQAGILGAVYYCIGKLNEESI